MKEGIVLEIKSIFVVGAGLMGSGIAQVAAQGGYKVCIYDINEKSLEKALKTITSSVERFVKKGKLSEMAAQAALANVSTTTKLEDAAKFPFVVEAVFESLETKQAVFRKLDGICPPETILVSNTSGISISKIASVTGRPEKVAGMHFFAPVPMMKLVEVISGIRTSRETMDITVQVGTQMGKEPVRIVKDFGGFIINRVYLPYIKMSIQVLTEGMVSVDELDKAVKLGLGYPMGPIELGDMVGWDIMYDALNAIYIDTNDPSFAPPPLLKRMVDGKVLGKKTGAGFYTYDEAGNRTGVNRNISI
ncbi:MAG TPA: 3-hydroxyacyl-CoA dehydrogenase family protein [Negativicutes bacterium]|nr:3-hydroxyacyl-CoA dehydrogenase family protein [Negativicutes bacterium]